MTKCSKCNKEHKPGSIFIQEDATKVTCFDCYIKETKKKKKE